MFGYYIDLEKAIVKTPTPEKVPLDLSGNDPSPSAPPPSTLYPMLPQNSSLLGGSPQLAPEPLESNVTPTSANAVTANCRSEFNMLRVGLELELHLKCAVKIFSNVLSLFIVELF